MREVTAVSAQELAEIRQKHVAEIMALKVLCVAEINKAELDVPMLVSIVSAAIASHNVEESERLEAMPWEEAIGSLAVELWKHYHTKTVCIPNPRCLQQ